MTRIVVLGGTGLIGSRVARLLQAGGQEVVVATRGTGVNAYTGEGLAAALEGAEVLVDASNASYVDEAGAQEYFEVSTLNLLTYGAAAGIGHHVALSVVGTDRLARSEGGYFRGKQVQEQLIRESSRAHSIVHSTQFFEFIASIADFATRGDQVRLGRALVQPIAADDVAAAVATVALGAPRNGLVEFGGPERFRLDELIRRQFALLNDPREVVADPLARYFGVDLVEDELLPGSDATLSTTRFADWLKAPANV